MWFRYKLSKLASNRGRRRIVDPALESGSLLAIVLLMLTVPTRLEDLAESRVEVGQEGDQNQARDNIFRVQVQNTMNVDDI